VRRTIKASAEVDALFKNGARSSRAHLMMLVGPTPPGRGSDGRVVFIAGKRLGGAVVRNRCKRLLREAVRQAGGPWPGYDIAIIARREFSGVPTGQLDAELTGLLGALEVGPR
jgi:ribonuclease P protein component